MEQTEEEARKRIEREKDALRRERRKANIRNSKGDRIRLVTGEVKEWKSTDVAPTPAVALHLSQGNIYPFVLLFLNSEPS